MKLFAYAKIYGNSSFPTLTGIANFFKDNFSGIWIEIEVKGLPDGGFPDNSNFFGLHIHELGNCSIPFDKTGAHYNPSNNPHPYHAGDLPPLLGNSGYAFLLVYTNRLTPEAVIDRSIIIHRSPDDFTSQPSGNAGDKIGCGVIKQCNQYSP